MTPPTPPAPTAPADSLAVEHPKQPTDTDKETPRDLQAEQIALEATMYQQGLARIERHHRKHVEKGRVATASPGAMPLVRAAIEKLHDAILKLLRDADSGKPGRRSAVVKYLTLGGGGASLIDPLEAAAVAVRTTLDLAFGRDDKGKWIDSRLNLVAGRVGSAVDDSLRCSRFREDHKPLYDEMVRNTRDAKYLRGRFRHMLNAQFVFKYPRLTHKDRVKLGLWMVEKIAASSGLIKLERGKRVGRRQPPTFVRVTDKMLQWMEDRHEYLAHLRPVRLPMVYPPDDWTALDRGGYLTPIGGYGMVKTFNKVHREQLRAAFDGRLDDAEPNTGPNKAVRRRTMRPVVDAVNAIQAVPWRINRRVLDVARAVFDLDNNLAGIPKSYVHDEPPKPPDIATNREARKAWAKRKSKWFDDRRAAFGRRLAYESVLNIAHQFAKYDRIYFPHRCDWRGRVYPLPTPLSPQGNKLCKGLLTFAGGLPLEHPEHWAALKRHGANCFGLDKEPFTVRERWVDDNTDAIRRVAADPLGDDKSLWTDADSPWQALAFCFEWADAVEHGDGFVSSLPCYIDGTANGIQHFALMAGCTETAEMVNVVNQRDEHPDWILTFQGIGPSDIYKVVADAVKDRLEHDARSRDTFRIDTKPYCWFHKKHHEPDQTCNYLPGDVLAEEWRRLGIVDRKFAKTPVMVLPYGGTKHGCREYVEAKLAEWESETGSPVFSGEKNRRRQAVMYMGNVLWEVMTGKIPAALACMEFFKGLARAATAAGLPLSWTVPSGFPVLQPYSRKPERLYLTMDGRKFSATIRPDHLREGVAGGRASNAASPNVVHSFDAAHLALTVNQLRADGVEAIAVNHDSFGGRASDMGLIADRLRWTLFEMYEVDWLVELRQQVASTIGEQAEKAIRLLPTAPPRRGRLNPQHQLKADFLFS